MATGTIVDSGHPCRKTRVMVRRPTSAASKFNGTVVVEWINVTPGRDLDIDWLQAHDYWMRTGYAWVGVSAQRVGVEALKVWNARSIQHARRDRSRHHHRRRPLLRHLRAGRTGGSSSLGASTCCPASEWSGFSRPVTRSRRAGWPPLRTQVHPLAPVFDAVVPHGGGGRIRDDLTNVKVFKLLAETDVIDDQASVRQPDTANFRDRGKSRATRTSIRNSL